MGVTAVDNRRELAELETALAASRDLQEAIEASSVEARYRLDEVLERYQAEAHSVIADGNCQFRALSVGLFGDQEKHAQIRQHVVAQLKANPDRYESFVQGSFDEYVHRMGKDGEWGDNVTLQAAADAFAVV